uniref:Zinc finger GRF-type domain-containing protein n=1 Tax=Brassica oleracea var. oleracea TaxID=109376 RepID=A0A0D3BSZ9_BRAOL
MRFDLLEPLRLRKMRQDYSYTQPSSSEDSSLDITSLLQAEADIYADEAQSMHNISEPKDPGRRYFTCENADDGDCHIWKWWDIAVMEEMSDFQRQLREVKSQHNESEQKLVKVEETVSELSKKISGIKEMFLLAVCVLLSLFIVIFMVIMLGGRATEVEKARV